MAVVANCGGKLHFGPTIPLRLTVRVDHALLISFANSKGGRAIPSQVES